MTILSERTISAFPVSIGTSLALESIFKGRLPPYDAARMLPEKIIIANYDTAWINLATLLRNMIQSLSEQQYLLAPAAEYANELIQEITIIRSLFEIEGGGVCKVNFYHCDYGSVYLKSQSPAVTLRKARTINQKHIEQLTIDVVKLCRKFLTDDVVFFDDVFNRRSQHKGIILTHIPYDLLSWPYFRSLKLLESYTGVLKEKNHWYTKYCIVPGGNLNILPFDRKLLKVFGDHIMFTPMPLELRRKILEIAIKRRWTPLTTMDKMKHSLEADLNDPLAIEVFRTL